jgi:uncharacterized protein (DUF697 family)
MMVTSPSKQQKLIELAQQGNPKVIAALLNKHLKSKGIIAKVDLKENCLQLMFEATKIPPQDILVEWIKNFTLQLDETAVKQVKMYGKKSGDDFPQWQQDFELPLEINTVEHDSNSIVKAEDSNLQKNPFLSSIWGSVTDLTEKAGKTANFASQSVTKVTVKATETVTQVTTQTHQVVGNTASTVTQNIVKTTNNVSKNLVETASNTGKTVSYAAIQTTDKVGSVMSWVHQSPLLKSLTSDIIVDWLIDIINQVDIVKAETEVQQLQAKYPDETPHQISHRIILKKALYVGGTGIVTSLIPGVATALITVDIAATTAIQAEMVYQIACAYGFDLNSPTRKGEIVAVFGLALGGTQAVKAGIGLLKNLPVAGAVISGSTNAVMLYGLGYAACKFYQSQLEPVKMEAYLETAESEIQHYLTAATDQQVLMDQILVHVILAGNPEKTWQQILPELEVANISQTSLTVIEQNIKNPPTLETLIQQLNQDFAVILLAQCQKIAEADGIITPEEQSMIETITHYSSFVRSRQ